jgi:integration host factor subunit alpha
MALTKADFAENLFNELGLNKREAKDMVDLFFEEIKRSLDHGEQVKLSPWTQSQNRQRNSDYGTPCGDV